MMGVKIYANQDLTINQITVVVNGPKQCNGHINKETYRIKLVVCFSAKNTLKNNVQYSVVVSNLKFRTYDSV